MAYYLTRLLQIMHPYLSVMKTAFSAFPFVAFLITIPYMIVQYKKFGSIPLLRTAVVYSFVLYCMTVYYLAILPLPSVEQVVADGPVSPNFIPYIWIKDFTEKNALIPWTGIWFSKLLHSFDLRETFFNICMFFPLGIYLRYYFKAKFLPTLLTGFCCSLFIELTQLSGLYFIYPYAYRAFDTTDLCNNTLGAVVGFVVTPLVCHFLPSRDKLDERAYKKGTNVPLFRRLLGLVIDWLVFIIVGILLDVIFIEHMPENFNRDVSYIILYAIFVFMYFIVLQKVTHGYTLGHLIMKMRTVDNSGRDAKFWQLAVRYIMLYALIVPSPFCAVEFAHIISTNDAEGAPLLLGLIGIVVCGILLCTFASDCLMKLLGSDHDFLYGRISRTKCVSTIEIPKNIEVIINSEKDGTKIYAPEENK